MAKKEIILISGKFRAGIQPNHLTLFETARYYKSLYDNAVIVVAMNNDVSLKKLKQHIIYTENDRLEMAMSIKDVDAVMLFEDINPASLCETIRPTILIKGHDWTDVSDADIPEFPHVELMVFAPQKKKYHTSQTFKDGK